MNPNPSPLPMNSNPSTPLPTGRIRFAIIGCGHIGRRHAEFIGANPECELVALCDSLPLLQTDLADLPGPAAQGPAPIPFFRDEDELFKQDFEILCVATPNGLHERHALKALQNGRHVLIEKPMALTSAACSNIIREAQSRDRQIFCVMQNRYSAPSVWLKDLLEKKALGRIFLVTVNCFWNRDERYYRKGGWKGTAALDGGSLFTQFSHFIDSLLWLFGDIAEIEARFANFSHGDSIDFEDTGMVNFNFVQGGMGAFHFSTSVRQQNLESSMTVIAEKGTIRIGGQYMEKVEVCTLESYPALPAPSQRPNHHFIYDNILSVLKRGGRPDIDAKEAHKVVETIERIYSRKQPF
jgi:UDP-N-acetyl-2-amino-2-deoxyglucuronate dehydrogenase